MTRPEALTAVEIASKLVVATGREIRYVDVPIDGVREAMIARSMPEWFVGAMVEVMEHTRGGAAAHVTRTVAQIIGRPARSYDGFARDSGRVRRIATTAGPAHGSEMSRTRDCSR